MRRAVIWSPHVGHSVPRESAAVVSVIASRMAAGSLGSGCSGATGGMGRETPGSRLAG